MNYSYCNEFLCRKIIVFLAILLSLKLTIKMERLNFNHLYYFYIVAKEGSIKVASEKLFVSQPTISDQLRLLEDYFRCKLFERRNRSLVLTPSGQEALGYAQKVFDIGRELTSVLRSEMGAPRNSVEIGVSYSMSQYFLYDKIMPLFSQKEMYINVKENERHLSLAELEEGNLDIVFTDNKDNITSNMSAYRVGVNKTFAVAHSKYKKLKKDFPQSLQEINFFNYTKESSLRYEIELFFAKHAISPSIIGEADDIDLFQIVTHSALAFTIVPEVAKNRLCQNKEIIVLGELEDLQTSVWGIVKKNYKGIALELLNIK